MKKCTECNAVLSSRRGPHVYDPNGIRVTLLDVVHNDCEVCGYSGVEIPGILSLQRAIANDIVCHPGQIEPAEIRFLRKFLGLSSQALADRMGVDKATVSRWENGKQPFGAQAERLLRVLVRFTEPVTDYSTDFLAAVRKPGAMPRTSQYQRDGKSWGAREAN